MQDNNTTKSEIGQVLSDKRTRGKKKGQEQPWREHKVESLLLSDSYKRLGRSRIRERVRNCGTFLAFKRFEDAKIKLHQAYFCKDRLCPMCAWRRSLKVFGQVAKIMNTGKNEKKLRYVFLTLTLKNVEAEELSPTIDLMTDAFVKLKRRKPFKNAVVGWLRVLEIAYNPKRKDFHPHFHVILAVEPDYFSKDNQHYLSQEKWCKLWRKSLKIDYNPIVDIRAVKASKQDNSVAEMAKYSVKSNSYLIRDKKGEIIEPDTDFIVNTLNISLRNRRLIAMGGILKDIHQRLNMDDMEDGNLINADIEENNEELKYTIETYAWSVGVGDYTLRAITGGEKSK